MADGPLAMGTVQPASSHGLQACTAPGSASLGHTCATCLGCLLLPGTRAGQVARQMEVGRRGSVVFAVGFVAKQADGWVGSALSPGGPRTVQASCLHPTPCAEPAHGPRAGKPPVGSPPRACGIHGPLVQVPLSPKTQESFRRQNDRLVNFASQLRERCVSVFVISL